MKKYSLISKEGIVAGVACAIIPLFVIGIMINRYFSNPSYFYDIGITMAIVIIVYSLAGFFLWRETRKLEQSIVAGDMPAPTIVLKLLYGAAHGMIVCIAVIFLIIIFSFFVA